MMKGFVKSGKWMGLMILMAGLLFAGCANGPSDDSSEEAAVTTGTQTMVGAVPMEFTGNDLLIGTTGVSASTTVGGELVEVVDGGPCSSEADGAICPVDLINRSSMAMYNTYIWMDTCTGCVGAELQTADVQMDLSGNIVTVLNDFTYNEGAIGPIEGGGFCYAEQGDFSVSSPWNATGCPIQDIVSGVKPKQIIHPECGLSTNNWDFGGQTARYYFWAHVTSDYMQWDAPGKAGYDFEDRSTFYVMVLDLADNLAAAPKAMRRKYRIGSYQRSNVLKGYSGSGVDPGPGQYFSVGVMAEYANRIENYGTHGNTAAFAVSGDYEYLKSASIVLRYNPDGATFLNSTTTTAPSGTNIASAAGGSLTMCNTDSGGCLPGDETYTGYGISVASAGTGYIATSFSIEDAVFTYWGAYSKYYDIWSNYAYIVYANQIPKMMGHAGLVTISVPNGYVYYASTALNMELEDADPDLPLSMYYFIAGASGSGSEFWIDAYSGFTNFSYGWTNGTLTPGGFSTTPGASDDEMSPCVYEASPGAAATIDPGCASPNTQGRIVHNGNERTNPAIPISGDSAPGYEISYYGGYQQWPAHICVQ